MKHSLITADYLINTFSMTPQELWQATLGELETLLSKANFTTWFRHTNIVSYDDNKVVINVPNIFTKEYLAKKYHSAILKAIRNITNNPNLKEIEYKIESSIQNKSAFTRPTETIINNEEIIPAKEVFKTSNQITNEKPLNNNKNNLNYKYTLNTFIVGKNNDLAHAASLAVIKSPGTAYNPLFIYGGVGLGKTHLMHAIGNKILENSQEMKVFYTTCENFTNDYLTAVRNLSGNGQRSMEDFNNKYRTLDVLLVDDIQFLSNKERTEEVFFNIFNELHQSNKQIIISSDRPPKAIPDIEQRLISRFEWGMIVDISIPDLETKIAIIQEKLKEKNTILENDIIEYLAGSIRNNIRELEGVLNRVIALTQLQNRSISLEEVKQITAATISNNQKNNLTPKNIIKLVSEYYDITIDNIISPCRKKNLTEPRQITMYLMREELKLSYPVIGQELGGRDHTTVIHACDKIINLIKINEKIRQDINIIKQKLFV